MIDPEEKIRRVELMPPDAEWAAQFQDAASEIKAILGNNCIAVHHIGSTAIPDIYAKPIVDILPVVRRLNGVDALNQQFEALGYVCIGEYGIAGRRIYWRSKLERTHNIKLAYKSLIVGDILCGCCTQYAFNLM